MKKILFLHGFFATGSCPMARALKEAFEGTVADALFPLRPTKELFDAVAAKPFPVLDDQAGERMQALILEAWKNLDSVGGVVECAATGLPAGLGEPMFGGSVCAGADLLPPAGDG